MSYLSTQHSTSDEAQSQTKDSSIGIEDSLWITVTRILAYIPFYVI